MLKKIIQLSKILYSIHSRRSEYTVNKSICKKRTFKIAFKEIVHSMNWGDNSSEIAKSINETAQINNKDVVYKISQPTVFRWMSENPTMPNENTKLSIESRVNLSSEKMILANVYWNFSFEDGKLLVRYMKIIKIIKYILAILPALLIILWILSINEQKITQYTYSKPIKYEDGEIYVYHKNETSYPASAANIIIRIHASYYNQSNCFKDTKVLDFYAMSSPKEEYGYNKIDPDSSSVFGNIIINLSLFQEDALKKIERSIPPGLDAKFRVDLSKMLPCLKNSKNYEMKNILEYDLIVWEFDGEKSSKITVHFK